MDNNEGLFMKWLNAFLEWFWTYFRYIAVAFICITLIVFAAGWFRSRNISDDERRIKAFDDFLEEHNYWEGDVIKYLNHEWNEGDIDIDDVSEILGGKGEMFYWISDYYEGSIISDSAADFVDSHDLSNVLNWYFDDFDSEIEWVKDNYGLHIYDEDELIQWVIDHCDWEEVKEWYDQ